MKSALMLGNGLNRASKNNESWEDLLSKLFEEFVDSKDVKYDQLKSLPLPQLYEYIVLKGDNAGLKEREKSVKDRIASIFDQAEITESLRAIAALSPSEIITTNYDYCIEKALSSDFKPAKGSTEITYSMYRKHMVGETQVWHMHGENSVPGSICLGSRHYAENGRKLLDFWKHGQKRTGTSFVEGIVDHEKTVTWSTLFVTHNVHIIGSGLDYSELLLWWVLQQRCWTDCKNNIRFYNYDTSEYSLTTEKRLLLEATKVEVVDVKAGSWTEFYDEVVSRIDAV